MSKFQPRDPNFAERVTATFLDETIAFHWGGELASLSPGVVEVVLSFRDDSTGGPGMLHRSIVAALLDDACVLAALSLSPLPGYGENSRIQAQLPCPSTRRAGNCPGRGGTSRPECQRLPGGCLRRWPPDRQNAGDAFRVPPRIARPHQVC